MSVERVNYYSDEEYNFARQVEAEQHREWMEEQEIQQHIWEQEQEELEEGRKTMDKMSLELKAIAEAVDKWIRANDGNVALICDFVAFDGGKIERNEEDVTKEDRIFAFGSKEILQISLDDLRGMLEKEEEDFINW